MNACIDQFFTKDTLEQMQLEIPNFRIETGFFGLDVTLTERALQLANVAGILFQNYLSHELNRQCKLNETMITHETGFFNSFSWHIDGRKPRPEELNNPKEPWRRRVTLELFTPGNGYVPRATEFIHTSHPSHSGRRFELLTKHGIDRDAAFENRAPEAGPNASPSEKEWVELQTDNTIQTMSCDAPHLGAATYFGETTIHRAPGGFQSRDEEDTHRILLRMHFEIAHPFAEQPDRFYQLTDAEKLQRVELAIAEEKRMVEAYDPDKWLEKYNVLTMKNGGGMRKHRRADATRARKHHREPSRWERTPRKVEVSYKGKGKVVTRTIYRNTATGDLRVRKYVTRKDGTRRVTYVKF
jgi:hypothetical protein